MYFHRKQTSAVISCFNYLEIWKLSMHVWFVLSMQRDATVLFRTLRVKDVIVRHGRHPTGVVQAQQRLQFHPYSPDKGVKKIYSLSLWHTWGKLQVLTRYLKDKEDLFPSGSPLFGERRYHLNNDAFKFICLAFLVVGYYTTTISCYEARTKSNAINKRSSDELILL